MAYSVYVVVADGFTVTLLPRTAPTPGEMITYDVLLTLQERVTLPPEETFVELAAKLAMVGAAPEGTFEDV